MSANPPPIEVLITGDPTQVGQALATAQRNFAGFSDASNREAGRAGVGFSSLVKQIGAVATAYLGLRQTLGFVKSSFEQAGNAEELKTQFATILGSAEAAEKRFDALQKMGAATPFNLAQLGQASKLLQNMTGDALAVGDGLTLVGDAIADTRPEMFMQIADNIGRVYNAIQSGTPMGEAARQLQMWGVVSSDAVRKTVALAKLGKKEDAWAAMADSLRKHEGGMDRLSRTWKGRMSTLQDAWDIFKQKFAEPLMNALNPALKGLSDFIEGLQPKALAFGTALVHAFQRAQQAWQAIVAMFERGDLFENVTLGLQVGFMEAVNLLVTGSVRAVQFVGALLGQPGFWGAMFDALKGTVLRVVGLLVDALTGIVEVGRSFVEPIVTAVTFAWEKLRDGATIAVLTLKVGFVRAVDLLLAGLNKIPGIDKLLGGKITGAREWVAESIANTETGLASAMESIGKTWAETADETKKRMDVASDTGRLAADMLTAEGTKTQGEALDTLGQNIKDTASFMSGKGMVNIFDTSTEKAVLSDTLTPFFKDLADITKREIEAPGGGKAGTAAGGEGGPLAAEKIVASSLAAIGGGGGIYGGNVQQTIADRLAGVKDAVVAQTDKIVGLFGTSTYLRVEVNS